MRKFLILILLITSYVSNGQDLLFEYDQAGNQVKRELSFDSSGRSQKESKEITNLIESDLLKFSDQDLISYYPNPVREELYLEWQIKEEVYVVSIDLYSLTGQLLRRYDNLSDVKSHVIPFSFYTEGIYNVSLNYSNGDIKNIKIIKK